MPLSCQKELFQLSNEVSYLNCAYMSPQLKRVAAIGHQMVDLMNEPYRVYSPDFFTTVQTLKANFAQLLHILLCLLFISKPVSEDDYKALIDLANAHRQ